MNALNARAPAPKPLDLGRIRKIAATLRDLKPIDLQFEVIQAGNEAGNDATDGTVAFYGIAYSGGLIPRYGWHQDCAIDLDDVELPDAISFLRDHDPGKIVGQGKIWKETTPDGKSYLACSGRTSKATEHAQEVAALLLEKHPLQMSVGMSAGADYLERPEVRRINGRDLFVYTIFRNAMIREASVVACGADNTTTVYALSAQNPTRPPMELSQEQYEALQADLAAARQRADDAEAQLKQLRQEKRKAELTAIFQAAGQNLTDEMATAYMDLTDAQFDAITAQLKAWKPATPGTPRLPENLSHPQGTDGREQRPDSPLVTDMKRRHNR
jgi:hypothetical protein